MGPLDHRQHGHGVVIAVSGPRRPEQLPLTVADIIDKAEGDEHQRLRAYRLHLADVIADVSPVVLDLADALGTSLDEIVSRLSPPPQWCRPPTTTIAGHVDGPLNDDVRVRARRLPGAEAPVRLTGHSHFRGDEILCTFTVMSGRIEALAVVDGVPVQTCRDRASVLAMSELWSEVINIGGTADHLAPGRLLIDRGYVVEAVNDLFAADRRLVTLRTGLIGDWTPLKNRGAAA